MDVEATSRSKDPEETVGNGLRECTLNSAKETDPERDHSNTLYQSRPLPSLHAKPQCRTETHNDASSTGNTAGRWKFQCPPTRRTVLNHEDEFINIIPIPLTLRYESGSSQAAKTEPNQGETSVESLVLEPRHKSWRVRPEQWTHRRLDHRN